MKKFKKSLVLAVAALMIGGGGFALANSWDSWGGEDDVDAIYQAVDELDSQLTVKKRSLKEAQGEATTVKAELESAKAEHKEALLTIEAVNNEILEQASNITMLKTDIETTKNQVNERDEIIVQKSQKLDKYVDLLAQYANNNKEVIEQAQVRINSLEQTIAELEEDYTAKAEKVKVMSVQIDSLIAQKQNLEAENQQLKATNDDTQAKLDAALNDVEMLKNYANDKLEQQNQ